MKPGDYVIYKALVTSHNIQKASEILVSLGIQLSKQERDKQEIRIKRLCTFYRGDTEEKAWQESIAEALDDIATVKFNVAPWSMLPGYPIETEGWDELSDELLPM